jgi:hypothetical protein
MRFRISVRNSDKRRRVLQVFDHSDSRGDGKRQASVLISTSSSTQLRAPFDNVRVLCEETVDRQERLSNAPYEFEIFAEDKRTLRKQLNDTMLCLWLKPSGRGICCFTAVPLTFGLQTPGTKQCEYLFYFRHNAERAYLPSEPSDVQIQVRLELVSDSSDSSERHFWGLSTALKGNEERAYDNLVQHERLFKNAFSELRNCTLSVANVRGARALKSLIFTGCTRPVALCPTTVPPPPSTQEDPIHVKYGEHFICTLIRSVDTDWEGCWAKITPGVTTTFLDSAHGVLKQCGTSALECLRLICAGHNSGQQPKVTQQQQNTKALCATFALLECFNTVRRGGKYSYDLNKYDIQNPPINPIDIHRPISVMGTDCEDMSQSALLHYEAMIKCLEKARDEERKGRTVLRHDNDRAFAMCLLDYLRPWSKMQRSVGLLQGGMGHCFCVLTPLGKDSPLALQLGEGGLIVLECTNQGMNSYALGKNPCVDPLLLSRHAHECNYMLPPKQAGARIVCASAVEHPDPRTWQKRILGTKGQQKCIGVLLE